MKAEWTNNDSLTSSQTTKAILVIDIPDEYVGSNIDVNLYGKNHTIHERYVNKLKLMPEKMRTNADDIEEDSYWSGWNECIDEILGETE